MSATDFGDPREIIHIPARDLTGSREEKLEELDTLLAQLQIVRLLLCGQGVRVEVVGATGEPPDHGGKAHRLSARLNRILKLLLFCAAFGVQPAAAQVSEGSRTPIVHDGCPQAPAPDPWHGTAFGVTLEAFYQYNWNRLPDRGLLLRAYDTRANTFSIQQAAIVIDAAPNVDAGRRHGLRVDLQFGQATDTVQGSAANEARPDIYRHIWQAYGSYVFPIGEKGLRTDFGKFASMLGYETNYAKDNQAFSRAYLFNFLPFYHSGVRATFAATDKVSLLYMLTNGIQQTEDFNDFKSNHFAAIVKPASTVTWTVNYYFGQEQADRGEPRGPDGFFRVFDTYVTLTPTSALTLGADVNYTTNEVNKSDPSLSLQGLGTYARYQVTAPVAVGVRYERLDDEGLIGGIDQVLHEITLTAEHRLADDFIVRAEFRRDWSSQAFFPGSLGSDDLRKHQNTMLVGGIWVIGTKTGAW